MFKVIIVCLCLLIASPCYAAVDWNAHNLGVQNDKWFHVGAGFAIDTYLRNTHPKMSWLERKLWVMGAGVIKESTDKRFDFEDLGATVIGGLLGDVIVIRF